MKMVLVWLAMVSLLMASATSEKSLPGLRRLDSYSFA